MISDKSTMDEADRSGGCGGRRLHYARDEVELDRGRKYEQKDVMKPNGLWYSVEGEDDWPMFCRYEEWNDDGLRAVHEVILELGKVLRITTGAELVRFHRDYSAVMPDWRGPSDYSRPGIDWFRVSREYAGIEIAPYQWEHRLTGMMWYYGWDCASGCIWDLEVLQDFRRLSDVGEE